MFQSETCTKADNFFKKCELQEIKMGKTPRRNTVENSEKYLPHPFRMDFLILSMGGFRPQHDHTAPVSAVKTLPVVTAGYIFFLYVCKNYVVDS